jgi:hypothetical protein
MKNLFVFVLLSICAEAQTVNFTVSGKLAGADVQASLNTYRQTLAFPTNVATGAPVAVGDTTVQLSSLPSQLVGGLSILLGAGLPDQEEITVSAVSAGPPILATIAPAVNAHLINEPIKVLQFPTIILMIKNAVAVYVQAILNQNPTPAMKTNLNSAATATSANQTILNNAVQ